MNRTTKCAVAGLVVLGGAIALAVRGEPPSWLNPVTEESAMQAMMEAATPGEPHAWLGRSVGEYDCTMRVWMDPSAPPMEAKATAKRYWKIKDTWLMEEFKCDNFMGMPYEGFGVTTWSNVRKQFVSTWCDSMGTSLMVAKGSMSADMKIMTMIGEMDEPTTGEIGKPVKMVTRVLDQNRAVMEMYEILYGDEFKVMEIEYVKKK